jgi:hypothetical protein
MCETFGLGKALYILGERLFSGSYGQIPFVAEHRRQFSRANYDPKRTFESTKRLNSAAAGTKALLC